MLLSGCMVRLDGGKALMSCRVCRVVEGTQRQAEVGPLWREIGGQEDVRGAREHRQALFLVSLSARRPGVAAGADGGTRYVRQVRT